MLRLCSRSARALSSLGNGRGSTISTYVQRRLRQTQRQLHSERHLQANATDIVPPKAAQNDLQQGSTVSVEQDEASLLVDRGASGRLSIPLVFLRDSCPCKTCRHEVTHQRLVDTFKLPTRPTAHSVETLEDGLLVTWKPDSHQSLYPWAWLNSLFSKQTTDEADKSAKDHSGDLVRYQHWDSTISGDPPSIPYEEVMHSDSGVRKWTNLIRTHGFSMVEGCPATPSATEKLLERISFIRSTHYGAFWDFTSDLRSKDTAYTSISLEAHTDTNYFKDPAGLQMFHMLSHTDGDGGESLFVDGYRAAAVLAERSPRLVKALQDNRVLYECKGNDDVMLHASWPVLPIEGVPKDGDAIEPHEQLMPIRWNNSDRASTAMHSMAATKQWYEAARAFDGILKDPASEYWVQLKPGTPVIFDNYRVLHGRAAFTGKRRMCGGYINAQDFLSRWKTLNFPREKLLDESPAASSTLGDVQVSRLV